MSPKFPKKHGKENGILTNQHIIGGGDMDGPWKQHGLSGEVFYGRYLGVLKSKESTRDLGNHLMRTGTNSTGGTLLQMKNSMRK